MIDIFELCQEITDATDISGQTGFSRFRSAVWHGFISTQMPRAYLHWFFNAV